MDDMSRSVDNFDIVGYLSRMSKRPWIFDIQLTNGLQPGSELTITLGRLEDVVCAPTDDRVQFDFGESDSALTLLRAKISPKQSVALQRITKTIIHVQRWGFLGRYATHEALCYLSTFLLILLESFLHSEFGQSLLGKSAGSSPQLKSLDDVALLTGFERVFPAPIGTTLCPESGVDGAVRFFHIYPFVTFPYHSLNHRAVLLPEWKAWPDVSVPFETAMMFRNCVRPQLNSAKGLDREHKLSAFSCSPDFRSVVSPLGRFTFSTKQAEVVKILCDEFPNSLGQDYILNEIGSKTNRLLNLFRSGSNKHPAWGTLIVPDGKKGCYMLNPDYVAPV